MNGQDESDRVYGRWPVKEALEAGGVSKLYVSRGAARSTLRDLLHLAKRKGVHYVFIDRRKIDQMASGRHQGVVALVSPFRTRPFSDLVEACVRDASAGPALIFLDGVQDPQNVGSILRSAVFFGAKGVVVTKWRSAPLTGAVVRASAGAAGFISVAQVSNLATALREAKKRGFWIVGADMAGAPTASLDVPKPCALVLGAEGEGLHRLVKDLCDFIVAIPGEKERKGVASLNVSVACGILLHRFSGYNDKQ